MEEFITAIIVATLFCTGLRLFKIHWLGQNFPGSFIYIAGIFAWGTVLALLASVYSLTSLIIDVLASPTGDNLVGVIVIVIALGISGWLLYDRENVLDIRHMGPFLRAAFLFQNYDARRQEMLERSERIQMQEAAKVAAANVASGKPQNFIDISEGSTFNQELEIHPSDTPKGETVIDRLKSGETVDITELFTAAVAKKPVHPLYQFISVVRINPSDKLLSFNLVLPVSVTGAEVTPERLRAVVERVQNVLQTIVAEPWLAPYLPFLDTLKVTSYRLRKDEFDMTSQTAFLAVQVGVLRLRLSRGKPYDAASFAKDATVTALE